MSQPISARIVNYRIGIRTQMSREILIQFADSTALRGALIGKKVVWKHGKTLLTGQIVGFHGKKGMLRARFKKGVPGQAISTTVELVS